MRNAYDIRGAYELWDRYKPESLVSVVKIPHSMNPESLYTISNSLLKNKNTVSKIVTRRQEKPTYYARNGPAILIVKPNNILLDQLYAEKLIGYEMPLERSFDIDDYSDLSLVQKLL